VWVALEVGLLGWRLRQRAPIWFVQAHVCGALAGPVVKAVLGKLEDLVLPFVCNMGLINFRARILA